MTGPVNVSYVPGNQCFLSSIQLTNTKLRTIGAADVQPNYLLCNNGYHISNTLEAIDSSSSHKNKQPQQNPGLCVTGPCIKGPIMSLASCKLDLPDPDSDWVIQLSIFLQKPKLQNQFFFLFCHFAIWLQTFLKIDGIFLILYSILFVIVLLLKWPGTILLSHLVQIYTYYVLFHAWWTWCLWVENWRNISQIVWRRLYVPPMTSPTCFLN